MAERKNQEEPAVTVADDQPDAGVRAGQGTPTADMKGKELKDALAFAPDRELHPDGEPDHDADKTSVPGPSAPPLDRPPVASPRPDAELVRTLATGAGAHVPPNPDEYNPDGTPRETPSAAKA